MKIYSQSAKNTPQVFFNDSGTLFGDIKINGQSAPNGVPIVVTGNDVGHSFDFSVTLGVNGQVDAGDYSSTAIVIANFQ